MHSYLFCRSFPSITHYTLLNYASLYRTFFTYWVSFVQVIILIVMVAIYPFAPIGAGKREIRETVSTIVSLLTRHAHKHASCHAMPHYTTLHYTTLHYTTLHYTTLHYTTLHYTTLHYTTPFIHLFIYLK